MHDAGQSSALQRKHQWLPLCQTDVQAQPLQGSICLLTPIHGVKWLVNIIVCTKNDQFTAAAVHAAGKICVDPSKAASFTLWGEVQRLKGPEMSCIASWWSPNQGLLNHHQPNSCFCTSQRECEEENPHRLSWSETCSLAKETCRKSLLDQGACCIHDEATDYLAQCFPFKLLHRPSELLFCFAIYNHHKYLQMEGKFKRTAVIAPF